MPSDDPKKIAADLSKKSNQQVDAGVKKAASSFASLKKQLANLGKACKTADKEIEENEGESQE